MDEVGTDRKSALMPGSSGDVGNGPAHASSLSLAPLLPGHWEAVRRIYAQGIATDQATFETEVPTWEAWDAAHLGSCRLVAVEGAEVVGWAALSPVSERCVYGGVAEVSVYVGDDHRGRGIGSCLLRRLVDESEAHGIWTLQAGIFPENTASVHLHKKHGFREVGVRKRLGKLAGSWRDVLLMERRSTVVGV
jgi:L-amino acid N-acyltransferase YncA